jgi:hypothetical protein
LRIKRSGWQEGDSRGYTDGCYVYVTEKVSTGKSGQDEIVARMLESRRAIKGDGSLELDIFVRGRERIVKAVKENQIRPGTGCYLAAKSVVFAGAQWRMKTITGLGWDDWIPGDWGYIANRPDGIRDTKGLAGVELERAQAANAALAETRRQFQEGENIVYLGDGQFWGWFVSAAKTHKMEEWEAEVETWPAGSAVRVDIRTVADVGLLHVLKKPENLPGAWIAGTSDKKLPLIPPARWMAVPGTR